MATLDSLTGRIPSDLEALLMDPAQQKAMEDMLVSRASGDINQQAGNEAQRINENAFGRGMGLSSINAFAQSQNEQARATALAKARIDANTQTQAAARAALGQAASYVTAQNAQRQSADQFNRSLKSKESMNTQNLVGGGLAGLAGGLAKGGAYVYGDKIKGMLGGGKENPNAAGQHSDAYPSASYGTNPDAQLSPLEANPNAISSPDVSGGLSDLAGKGSTIDMPQFDYNMSGFDPSQSMSIDPSLFDMSGWGNTDLSQLFGNDWNF